jgi:ribosomal protein L40E
MKRNHPRQSPRICADCGAETSSPEAYRCRKCASKMENSKWNQRQVETARNNLNTSETTARSRYECRSARKDFCLNCGVRLSDKQKPFLEVHHKDRNPWNNAKANLQTLCSPCHHDLHAKEDSFGNPFTHKYLSYDQIVSIEFVGIERVFDLQMEAPNHNFIANGFVSHNSGPQLEISKDRMVPGQDYTQIYPWKIWETKDDKFGHGQPALNWYQPNMLTEALLKLYQYFFDQASEQAGIPSYMYGSEQTGGGGGDTATGLGMLMNNASKALKDVVHHIDDYIMKPVVKDHWVNIMLFDDDELKCGDINVVARASEYLIMEEAYQLRRLEFLKYTNNDTDIAISGIPFRADVLREVAKGLKIGTEFPSKDEIEMKFNPTVQQQPVQVGPDGQPIPQGPPGAPGQQPVQQQQRGGAIQRPGSQQQQGKAGAKTGPGGYPPGERVRMAK